MNERVCIIGAGLAGSQAALTLADAGYEVVLYEMRPQVPTPVHRTGKCAELVCSNSLKSMKPGSAAGMLKAELDVLGSHVFRAALDNRVPAGGALAVDRERFSDEVDHLVRSHPRITYCNEEVRSFDSLTDDFAALIIATGPLTSSALADELRALCGCDQLYFFDAAAPVVLADSLDTEVLFSQSRYEDDAQGDYLNAPLDRESYEHFIDELIGAERVVLKDFETRELFQACQPIEEIARKGKDAPRYGAMKPVGLTDPRTGRRPWAAVQLRREDVEGNSYNLVGFQTNLTFPEQKRVFRMIPGLEHARFARYGVMHRNTFVDAPRLLDAFGRLSDQVNTLPYPVYIAGQLSGTEGYCEAVRSGLGCAFALIAELRGNERVVVPPTTAFGSLMAHATNPDTIDYQPMHVNFGVFPHLEPHVRNKKLRYEHYAQRGNEALCRYRQSLIDCGVIDDG